MERLFDRDSFYKTLWKLMLPIVFQNLVNAIVSTADVLMLSGVSQEALSASSLAGQVTFVLTLFYLGVSTGASVLTAQYWGRKDVDTIGKVQGMALRYASLVSLLFFIAALAVPEGLMRLFTRNEKLVSLGAGYLRWVSASYLMIGVSQILLAVMKSMEETKLCAQISIYRSFLDGETPGSIARLLTARGVRSPAGKGKWHETTVRSMLQNEKYYGSALLQKHYTTDFLTHKVKKNEGELSQYYIENSHPAIISKEQWDLVQIELERRSRMKGRFSPKGPLASRLVCADCGAFFGAKTWHSSDPYKTVIWRCNDKYKPGIERQSGGGKCNTGHVTEEKVMSAFYKIVADLTAQRPQVLEACDEILRSLLDTSTLDDKRKRAEHERDSVTGHIQALVERQARETVDAFAEKYHELEKKYRRAEEKLKTVDVERRDREYRLKQAELFMATLKKMPEGEQIESNELFMALVDKVIVGEGLTFVLRDGSTRGVRF